MGFADYRRALFRRRMRPGRGVVVFQGVPSSHRVAGRILREYTGEGTEPPSTDFYAWAQSAGEGRQGRTWSSPAGHGVYATLLRSSLEVSIQTLPLRVAVALSRAVDARIDGTCSIRWPNDLLVGRRKIGGILIDVTSRGDELPAALISFGIDHGADLGAFDAPEATSVRAEGGDIGLVDLAVELTEGVDRALSEPETETALLDAYRRRSHYAPGDEVRLRRDEETLHGVFRGFDEAGLLRLEVDGRERLVASGEFVGSRDALAGEA